jgi:hypothetical protein
VVVLLVQLVQLVFDVLHMPLLDLELPFVMMLAPLDLVFLVAQDA